MFLDSDTDMAVLTFTPTRYEDMPLSEDEAAATRELVDALDGNQRLLLHGRVMPTVSHSWNASLPIAAVPTWPVITTIGIESM